MPRYLRCLQIVRPSLSQSQVFQSPFKSGRSYLHISTIPSGTLDALSLQPTHTSTAATLDTRFEVLGLPQSLLSVSLSASKNLYTRRGTIVGIGGKAENAVSTLSLYKPLRRALLGIPFLYQKLSSTTPLTVLVSTNSSIAVVHMDGSTDWQIPGKALLAWTGYNLNIQPTINWGKSLNHVGTSKVSGRGLFAIAGHGALYQIFLEQGEDYIVHPSNLIAYTTNSTPPSPYRLKSSSFPLQIPKIDFTSLFPNTKFFRTMLDTWTLKTLSQIIFNVRTWSRRWFWGDRLFLEFHGPTTLLVQSQFSRVSEVLTSQQVDEMADTPSGAVQAALTQVSIKSDKPESRTFVKNVPKTTQPTRMNIARIGQDGKVDYRAAEGSSI